MWVLFSVSQADQKTNHLSWQTVGLEHPGYHVVLPGKLPETITQSPDLPLHTTLRMASIWWLRRALMCHPCMLRAVSSGTPGISNIQCDNPNSSQETTRTRWDPVMDLRLPPGEKATLILLTYKWEHKTLCEEGTNTAEEDTEDLPDLSCVACAGQNTTGNLRTILKKGNFTNTSKSQKMKGKTSDTTSAVPLKWENSALSRRFWFASFIQKQCKRNQMFLKKEVGRESHLNNAYKSNLARKITKDHPASQARSERVGSLSPTSQSTEA